MNKKEAIQAMLDGKCVECGKDIVRRWDDDRFLYYDSRRGWVNSVIEIKDWFGPYSIVPDPSIQEKLNSPQGWPGGSDVCILFDPKRQEEINKLAFTLLEQLVIAFAYVPTWPGTAQQSNAMTALNLLHTKLKE